MLWRGVSWVAEAKGVFLWFEGSWGHAKAAVDAPGSPFEKIDTTRPPLHRWPFATIRLWNARSVKKTFPK